MIYYQDEWVTQYCSDALTALRTLESDSIDLLCTDPPYGIGFMGKDWDKALPDKSIWAECLRVLKPGAFGFVMSIPRSDCLSRMIISLEDAGFMVNFTPIYWAYASGFPKAQNIGKAVDKRGGVSVSWFGKWLKGWRLENGITQKEIAKLFPSKTGGLTGCVANWELSLNMPTPEQFTTICRHFNLPFESIEEAEREVIGYGQYHNPDARQNWGGEGYKRNQIITASATPQAKALDGSYGGFQPKPAVEVIIVCMKPLSEKTFVDQALKNGKGITWLDDCRIPYEGQIKYTERTATRKGTALYLNTGKSDKWEEGKLASPTISGRFPANLLVSDDVLNDGRDSKGFSGGGGGATGIFKTGKVLDSYRYFGDSGSFSRYFDLDKWAQKTFPFLICAKASKSEKNRGCEDLPEKPTVRNANMFKGGLAFNIDPRSPNGGYAVKHNTKMQNNHPTVKPLKLMSYLITLGSRPGDTVADPFGGSGTTALASKLLGRKCIISEIEEKYCEIAANRCRQMVMGLKV